MKVVFELVGRIAKQSTYSTSGSGSKVRVVAAYLMAALCIYAAQFYSTGSLYAQSREVNAPDDRSAVPIRYPKSDHLRELQTDRAYQYSNEAPPPDNPIARFFSWLFSKLSAFLSSESYQTVWQYVILVCIAGFVIYMLMKAEMLDFLFPRKAQSDELAYATLAENIHEINFDLAIEDAVNQRNFRLAVRLLYLQTLKRLTDSGQINYKPDKTNRQYVHELANTPLQPDFDSLTRQFDFVWYGDFPVDEAQFGQIRQQFQQFNVPRPARY